MKGDRNPKTVDRRLIVIWFLVGTPLLVATVLVDERFMFVLLGLGACLAIADLLLVRCPTCSKSMRIRVFRLRGRKVFIPLGWFEKKCSNCGTEILAGGERSSDARERSERSTGGSAR